MPVCVSTVDELQPVLDACVLRESVFKEQQFALVQRAVPLGENGTTRNDGR